MGRHAASAVPDRRHLSGHDRLALSSAPAARGKRLGVRLLGSFREQPEGALLRDHEGGTEAAGAREAALEIHHHGRRESPGGRMRRAWSRLQAMLRRLVDGGAGDEELSEELRAFVEHDTESKIRLGMTPEDARRAALIEL